MTVLILEIVAFETEWREWSDRGGSLVRVSIR